MVSKNDVTDLPLDLNGDGTWSRIYALDKDQSLEIHDIPQVLQANGQNLGGEQNNWINGTPPVGNQLKGLMIEVRGCECDGGGS